jgi:hypothetical protein
MPQGYLTGVAHQQIEADGDNDVNCYVIGHIYIIVLEKKGVEGKKKDEEDEPEKLDARREELDILVVVPFHVHKRFLRPKPKRCTYLFFSELVNQFLEIELLFLEKRGPFGRHVQFHDSEVDLFDEFVPFQIIGNRSEQVLHLHDLFPFLDLRGKTICIFEDFVSDPQVLGDMAVVLKDKGLSLAWEVIEFAFFDSLHNPPLNNSQITG